MSYDSYQIFIRYDDIILTLDVTGYDTIESVKAWIYYRLNIDPTLQVLVFNNRILEEGRTLMDYFIGKESFIDLFIRRKLDSKFINMLKQQSKNLQNKILYGVNSYNSEDMCLQNNPVCQRCGQLYYPKCRGGYRMGRNICGICYKL
jgi:hypothetical protein